MWIRISTDLEPPRRLEPVATLLMLRLDAADDVESVMVDEVLDLFRGSLSRSDRYRLEELRLADPTASIPLTRHNAAVLRRAVKRGR